MALTFGGTGVQPSLRGQASNVYALAPGQCVTIPAGQWVVNLGNYTNYQVQDTITGIWRNVGNGGIKTRIESDGVNHRLANQTGCTVGALITNAGTGYVSPPIVTASAGGSIWTAIVGNAINTAVTVMTGGAGYVYPPSVQFSAPPPGGIQATGYCTLSGGAVNAITVTNQGAGYSAGPPSIAFINDPREGLNGLSSGYGASAVASLTGAGTITGLMCLDHGAPQTAVPTLAFAGGGGSGAAATALMCWCITSYTASGGSGYQGTAVQLSAAPMVTAGTPIYTNPNTQTGLVRQRAATIYAPVSGGAIVAAGQVIIDGGIYENVPTAIVAGTNGPVTTATAITLAMGGLPDFTELYPV